MKILDPRIGGRGSDASLVGTVKSIKFTAPHTPFGWIRSCAECGQHFISAYRTATVRPVPDDLCTSCWLEAMRGAANE